MSHSAPVQPGPSAAEASGGDTMSIREMCDAYGVTPRTLRFYEQKELLFPQRQGTRRLFTRRDRARLKLILRGKRFGFSLEDIRQLLDMYDHNPNHQEAQLKRTLGIARERMQVMVDQRDELNEAIEDLRAQMALVTKIMAALPKNSA